MNIHIQIDNVIIKTTDEGQDDTRYPATVEITDAISGKMLIKLKAKSRYGAAGSEWVHRIEFERLPIEPSKNPWDGISSDCTLPAGENPELCGLT